MSSSDGEGLTISPEERAVILRMRQSERAGDAIFNYALKFSDDTTVDPDARPYRR